uniref:mannan endo-1,4-beta-mannosidase n=1 Tax=Mycena chlorophos TaxID=658473 RepID=A0ABQ0LUZ2_MYCCL|nr:predicted protein [Mycena chlorophos]
MLLSYLVPAFLASAMVVAKLVPPGFVTTNGVQFELDGEPFAFVGSNSYNSSELHQTPVETGLTYYQVWEDNDWILNEGSQGFERLDTVLEIAAEFDMRLILTFTNNWVGYGGMELYIDHILPGTSTHDVFYTDEEMIASYQRYVRTIVERYKDSATVFAWEMMNEARCLGDLPSGPDCSAQSRTIPNWYKLQSDYIRSLDPHHLITTGGEGHFNWDNSTLIDDYNFNGEAGEDFDYDLTFENVDFGTYHLYPQSWYPDGNFPLGGGAEGWGLFWIQAHANSAKKVGKPVVLEEFGVTPQSNQTLIYPSWVQLALDTKHGG